MKYLTRGVARLWRKDIVKKGGVTYFPRTPDQQDPPIDPCKLLMIERVKPYKGNPYWDKRVLDSLRLGALSKSEMSPERIAIVKNTPEICQRLLTIKHLIKITPIQLPKELPKDMLMNRDTYLHENGNLMVFPKLCEKRMEATEKFENNPKKLDIQTIKKYLRQKWLNPMESTSSPTV